MSEGEAVLIDAALLNTMPLPEVEGDTDKDARGRIIVVGGGASAPGAAILSGLAALRAGAGKLQLAVPCSFATQVGIALLEAGVRGFAQTAAGEPATGAGDDICADARATDAVVVGPGLREGRPATQLARDLLRSAPDPLYVIDAMALAHIAEEPEVLERRGERTILTPHPGEMTHLCSLSKEEIQKGPLEVARSAARRFQTMVVLKGADTCIARPDGDVFLHRGGVPGLATSGSGDVLAGLIGGLAARGTPPLAACVWGVFVHAHAGARLVSRIGRTGFLARELIDEIPAVLGELQHG